MLKNTPNSPDDPNTLNIGNSPNIRNIRNRLGDPGHQSPDKESAAPLAPAEEGSSPDVFQEGSSVPRSEFWLGVLDISPLALGVAIYGLAFGLLAAQAAMDELETGVMGALVFAGSSQIVVVERLVAGAGAVSAVVAGIALNLRLLLVTASIREVFRGRPLWQQLLGAHLTTDENWALMLATRARGVTVGYWYLVGGGGALLVTWLIATVCGVLFASAIPEPRALGMDFAFTAAFIAIARSLWRGDLWPWLTSVAVVALVVLGKLLDPSHALVLGGVLGAVMASWRKEETA
ncbi:AzlC family ABC transporter permease [Kiloniella laminariae]|uniref:AzlC family ABC transporter permease n=1 Tax=Kiloniella laminariae TaxID=454162 RepID=A0ABT4LEX7_9PROT|nr:AzlC family ABC transporter permease [Kiloniella laminariae]MCZ4279656.1 AzlC family ABC transporter permease [Kiloniella laminariae]